MEPGPPYTQVPQDDLAHDEYVDNNDEARAPSRPTTYYNEGEFSPPSSVDPTEKDAERDAFLYGDDEAGDMGPFLRPYPQPKACNMVSIR